MNLIEYEQASEQYIKNCKASGYSADTVENYGRALQRFSEVVTENGNIKPQTVGQFKEHLFQKGNKASTIKQYINCVAHFFEWAIAMGITSETPFNPIVSKVKVPPKHGYENLLTKREIAKLLSPIRAKGTTRSLWVRNYAIVCVFLTSGIRNSELRALIPSDLDWTRCRLRVENGKGSKERYAAFPKIAQNAVLSYMRERPNVGNDAPLFGIGDENTWHEMDRQTLSDLVERHVKMVAGRSGCRTHSLRHASASYLWSRGVSTEDLQELLGHSDVATTQIYLDRLNPDAPTQKVADIFSTLGGVEA